MITMKYVFMLVMLVLVGSMHDKFIDYDTQNEKKDHYQMVKQYLLNESSLARSSAPIIWIHVDPEINARWWASFGSRNTRCLNQPYQLLCIKSIVDKCGGHFNVCLIDDDSFAKIIPGWSVDMRRIARPISGKIRELALARILHYYGGMLVPSSFICFKDLSGIYKAGVYDNKMFVGEFIDKNITASSHKVFPNTRMMGCKANCEVMKEYSGYLAQVASTDFTDESVFLGNTSRWCKTEIGKDKIKLIKAEMLGAIDTDRQLVTIERLLGDSYIDLSPDAAGIYLPAKEILTRTAFRWFGRMNAKQVLESDTVAGKLLLVNSNPGK